MKQAIAYLRKSTDLQETSLEQQKEKILQFAKEHSMLIAGIITENKEYASTEQIVYQN